MEILMVVAVMSTIAAGAVFTLGNVNKAAQSTKLQRDVRVVNDAIRAYRLNGGVFAASDMANPGTLLAKLKKRATDASAKQMAGLRHSYADARLTYEMQSSGEAADGVERAKFIADVNNPRFEIVTSGAAGIRRFVMDSSLAATDFGTEDRRTAMKLAARDPWVWDYADSGTTRGAPATNPPVVPTTLPPIPPDATTLQLSPPAFSVPSGSYALNTYPRSLTLTSSNPAGTSQIVYNVNGGPFMPYSGPFNINPGQTIGGICQSLDPDTYDDSALATGDYQTTPLLPDVLLTFSKSAYNFFELGGLPAPGTPPPSPTGTTSGTGTFTNSALLPVAYHNSSVFRFKWTYDGSNPLTSPSAQQQPDFSGSFVSLPIPLPLSAFGSSSSVILSAAIKGENPAIVSNSVVKSRTLTASTIDLRQPTVTTDGRDVTLALDLSGRDMPQNARIYYTTDGTDPGVSAAGEPTGGTLYTAPFTLTGSTGADITVKARVYAPSAYLQFFVASSLNTFTYTLPATTDVYVGGNFVNSSGQAMRNIAKLGNSGQVDTRFDTGSGASADSMVGIVRQTGSSVLAGGDFDAMNGTAIQGIVRLNADGSVDAGFNAGLTSN